MFFATCLNKNSWQYPYKVNAHVHVLRDEFARFGDFIKALPLEEKFGNFSAHSSMSRKATKSDSMSCDTVLKLSMPWFSETFSVPIS